MLVEKFVAGFEYKSFLWLIGYSVTIAGGLMLGRKYDDAGKVLLIAGGVTGIVGTVLLVDSFKYLGRPHRRNLK